MDDKVFNLLEKMYVELTEFKQDMTEFKQDMTEFRKDITGKVTKIETLLENDIKPNIKLALEGYHDTNEKLTSIEGKIDNLESKIERHDVEINVIKRVK